MIQRYVAWCIGQKVMVDRSDNGDLCKYSDAESAIAAAVDAERAKFRWLDASEVTEPGYYAVTEPTVVDSKHYVIRVDRTLFDPSFWGDCRFFKLPDDKETT